MIPGARRFIWIAVFGLALSGPISVLAASEPYGVFLAGRDVLVGQKSVLEKIPACDTKRGEWGKDRMRGWGVDCSKTVGQVTPMSGFKSWPTEQEARSAYCKAIADRRPVLLTANRDWEARFGSDQRYYLIRNAPDCATRQEATAKETPQRDPAEVDAVLDSLGMMLAVAAAAPPPSWGVGRGAVGRAPFTWHEAAHLAHVAHATLTQLQHEGAHRRFNLTLTPAQINRIRALGHWVKWIYDRHAAWAARGAWEMEGTLLRSPTWSLGPDRSVPPPPPFPLDGRVPADVNWAFGPPPPIPETVQWFDTIAYGALGTAIDVGVVAAQVADYYLTGGMVFLVLTGGYAASTGSLTPLAWQLVAMSPIKYHGVPAGTAFLASISAFETVTGYELEFKVPHVRLPGQPQPLGPQGVFFDVRPLGFWDRVGKGSMSALLTLQASADAREATRTAALARPLEANPAKPLDEGPKVSIRELSTGQRDATGRVLATVEVLQPTIQGHWLLVKMEVLKSTVVGRTGWWSDGYLHPDTMKPLFIIGRDGYHATKHFFEKYPFGRVLEVTRVTVKQGQAPPVVDQRVETVPLDNNPYFTRDLRVLDTVDGRAVEVPGLKELFGDHPELVAPIRAFEAASTDPNYDPQVMRTTYVELINAVRRVFKEDMKVFTGKNLRYGDRLTGFLIQRGGHDYYIILNPEGGIINSMTLSKNFNPKDIAVGYRLQRGEAWDTGVTGRMNDLIETLFFDKLASMQLKLKGAKVNSMRFDERLKAFEPLRNDPFLRQALIEDAAFKWAIREEALRIYSLGGAAFRDRDRQ